MLLSPTEIDELAGRLAAALEPERIYLFGSCAKGTATADSDVDLLAVKATELPPGRRADAVAPLLARYLAPIDLHVYTPEEVAEYGREPLSFVDSVLRTGRIVFELLPDQPDLEAGRN